MIKYQISSLNSAKKTFTTPYAIKLVYKYLTDFQYQRIVDLVDDTVLIIKYKNDVINLRLLK